MRKRSFKTAALFVALLAWVSPGFAASLGEEYTSYRNLHVNTDYGALFINVGHFRTRSHDANKDFREIVGGGDVMGLRPQRGYCLAFNHYEPSRAGERHRYSYEITKVKTDGTQTVERGSGRFVVTSKSWSSDMPDLCVSGLWSVERLIITFTSTDGDRFDRTVAFEVAQ